VRGLTEQQAAAGETTFRVAVNRQVRGKLRPGSGDFGQFNMGFENEEMGLDGLIAVITAGHAWAAPHEHRRHHRPTRRDPNYLTTYRVKENVISSQLLALDADTGDARSTFAAWLADPFVSRHAVLLHETASATPDDPRTRVIFLLDEPLAPEEYELALQALLARYHFCDQSVKHAAAAFFGAPGCRYVRLNNVLPVAVMREELVAPFEAEREAERAVREAERARRLAARDDSVEAPPELVTAYVREAFRGETETVAALPAGLGLRHLELFTAAIRMGSLQAAAWLSPGAAELLAEAREALLDAAEANGYLADYGYDDAVRTVDNGMEIGLGEPAEEPWWHGGEGPAAFAIGQPVVVRAGERELARGRISSYRYAEDIDDWEFSLSGAPQVWYAGALLADG
jgi:hypothetical protein